MTRRFKRGLSIIMTICMLISMILPLSSTALANNSEPDDNGLDRSDLAGHWAKPVMGKWIDQGLIQGYGDNEYRPDRLATRAEFVVLMNQIFRFTQSTEGQPFTDVQTNAWYAEDVSRIYAAGIVEGLGGGKFEPEAQISREDAAVIVARAFRIAFASEDNQGSAGAGFTDYDQISSYALEAVAGLHAGGYIQGRENQKFVPKGKITRAEIVQLIDNVMGTLINKPGTDSIEKSGNLVVNTDGITLKDQVISGDLYVTQGVGEGDLILEGVTVKGKTYVMGGGKNSIKVKDSKLQGALIVHKWNSLIRILASGTTEIPQTLMLSGGILEEEGLAGDSAGFKDVEVKMVSPADNYDVTFIGKFMQIWNQNQGARFQLPLHTMINKFIFDEAADVGGEGEIEQANLNANGVSLNKWPKKVEFAKGISAKIEGKSVTEDIRNQSSGSGGFISNPPDTGNPSTGVSIVKSGIPNADIIISPSATDLEELAASELQSTIKMISGAELPIVVADLNNVVSVELRQNELNVTKSGKYPLQFQLLNNSNAPISVDLVKSDNGPIMLAAANGIELLAGQSKTVDSFVHVSQATPDGNYVMTIRVQVDGSELDALNLTVNLNRNLLFNSGMELHNAGAATPDGWYAPENVGSVDNTVAYKGNSSMKMNLGSYAYTHSRTNQELRLKQDTEYMLSAWVKGTSSGQSVLVSIEAGEDLSKKQQTFAVSDDWTHLEMRYTPDAQHALRSNGIYFLISGSTSMLWIDEVALAEVEPVSVHLQQSELNVTKSGNYPVQFQLANTSDTPVTLDLVQTDNSSLTLSSTTGIELGANQSKIVDSMVNVPATVADGTYKITAAVKLDGQMLTELTLTIHVKRNLLFNSGMELQSQGAYMPDGWYAPADVGSVDHVNWHTGSSSLKMSLGSKEYTHSRGDQQPQFEAGKEYLLSAWVKGTSPGQGVLLSIGENLKRQDFAVGEEWELLEMRFTLDAEQVAAFTWIYFFISGATDTLWIDDVTLVEVEPEQQLERQLEQSLEQQVEQQPEQQAEQRVEEQGGADQPLPTSPDSEDVTILSSDSDDSDRIQIILGTADSYPELLGSYAADLDFLKDSDGFAVRKAGNRIYILAAEPKGVLNGVYDFLEKNADIFWTRSVESGTLYEPQSTIKASKVDYREKSPFAVRGWHLTGVGANKDPHSDLETEKLMARNKLNAKFAETMNMHLWQRYEKTGLNAVNLGHNLEFWVPNNVYFAEHPEYYSTDLSGNPLPVAHDTQINFYNKDLPGVIAGRVKEFLKTQPIEYVGIGINDTHNFNMGELSKQEFIADNGVVVQPDDPAYKSTVFFNFLNQIAAKVKVTNPGVKIVTFAYFFTDTPPKVALEDNIVIVMAPANEDGRTPLNSNNPDNPNSMYKVKLEDWAKKTKNVVMYNYYGCCYTHSYERPMAEKVQADVKFYRDLGIMGVMPEGSVDYGIVDTIGMNMYPGVAPSWGVNALQFWLYHKLFWNPDADLQKLTREFMNKAYGKAVVPMQKYYDLIKQGWNSDQQVINFYSSESQLIGNYIIKAGIKDAAQSALNEAWKLADAKERARIEPIKKTFEMMTYLIGGIPKLSANAVKTTASKADILQALDFSQGPWVKAEAFNDFRVQKTRAPVDVETKVYLLWDDENLYVGYENFDDDVSKMIVSDSAPSNWWSSGADDSVETYITGDINGDFYAFFSNPKSVRITYKKGVIPIPETPWEMNANTETDRWNVIQVIPFASIGVDITKTDTLMGFFFRNYHGANGLYGWGGGSVWNSSDFSPIHLITKD
ncbi:DUF4838 domain-containing protein [Paenibacillus eucommiae]|uniref:SLH domain-containing protein n=1 Tax=Paenibacillus eucommiae TaxID=1355755 RepID=A0ABS4ILU2_9BACL|nr:DUF4838 domain-containing protein [Paenibacillus eucommiae]MBP1988532.1 hypothetical protein [Paenibacillus eucommiae]